MPDYTVSGDVDSMLRSANDAAIRSAIGVGTTDALTVTSVTLYSATNPATITRSTLSSYAAVDISGDGQVLARFQNIDGGIINIGAGYFGFGNLAAGVTGPDTKLYRGGVGTLYQRNLTTPQNFLVANSVGGAATTDYDRGVFGWSASNTLRIGTENGGTYTTARPIDFVTGGVVRMSIAAAGGVSLPTASSISFGGAYNFYGTTSSTAINGPSSFGQIGFSINGATKWVIEYTGLLCAEGVTAAFPALKRSTTAGQTTYLQARLANDSAFTNIQGKLTTDTAYTATTVVATGYITIYDSLGQAYRVPCAV